jgi:uncharacterized protein (TIGR03437 family)
MLKQARLALAAVLALYPVAAGFAQTPVLNFALNEACFSDRLSPGVRAAVFGNNFGNTTAGVSATVGGKLAAVLAVQPTVMNIQFPVDVATGMQAVMVARGTQASAAVGHTIRTYAPCIYVRTPETLLQNPSAVVDGVFFVSGLVEITRTRPALPGESIFLQAVGLGGTDPPVGTGVQAPSNPAAKTVTTPQLTVAGQPVPVGISILSPGTVGLYSVYFTVPAGLAEGIYQVRLSIGGE